jgi:hypothetical protein
MDALVTIESEQNRLEMSREVAFEFDASNPPEETSHE